MAVFTFESTLHPRHVLHCLDEQRRRDVLCDVTVVAGGQCFRAHRSVLASCSEYFTHGISSPAQHGAVVALPQEVTAAGFEPLLKFAYTSQLPFGKDNVLEVRDAASVLGFRDLDMACFDFLLPKFFCSPEGRVLCPRKTCCKKKHRMPRTDSGSDTEAASLDEKEVKPVADSSESESSSSGRQSRAAKGPQDSFRQCPKYRKFQLACGKDACAVDKSLTIRDESCSPISSSSNRKNEPTLPAVAEEPTRAVDVVGEGVRDINGRDVMKTPLHHAGALVTSMDPKDSGGEGRALPATSDPQLRCSFLQHLDPSKCFWKGAGGVSSLNSDSETETEGDSEASARERARQVQLPVSVDWIVDLSRNDFQQLLKQQSFMQEQLDLVHDVRRRSKNRQAAQRCRKRKLDCIYGLQREIDKLKAEREKLMGEKNQLSQLKVSTCHSVSALCQRVCSEAELQPAQLQVLAKYTSADCPLSSVVPHVDTLLSGCSSGCHEEEEQCGSDLVTGGGAD